MEGVKGRIYQIACYKASSLSCIHLAKLLPFSSLAQILSFLQRSVWLGSLHHWLVGPIRWQHGQRTHPQCLTDPWACRVHLRKKITIKSSLKETTWLSLGYIGLYLYFVGQKSVSCWIFKYVFFHKKYWIGETGCLSTVFEGTSL